MSRARLLRPTSRSSSPRATPPPPRGSRRAPRHRRRARHAVPRAHAARATGAVLLRPSDADGRARRAAQGLQRVPRPRRARTKPPAPGSSSPTRCDALGDHDAARVESPAAPCRARRTRRACRAPTDRPRTSTPRWPHRRELEVLVLLAAGQDQPCDRARAVHQREDRGQPRQPHLHQARRRLRSAATAYAYDHDLVDQ